MATLDTERLQLVTPDASHAEALASFFRDNREHLAPWDPPRPDGIERAEWWADKLPRLGVDPSGVRFLLIERSSGAVVGTANLSNIVRGPFQACTLGYSLDHRCEGRGLMTEALRRIIAFAFGDLELHRIMANHLPENVRSARVLARLGFEREGYAKAYLYIAGAWRDHVLTALTNPAPKPPPPI